MKQKLPFDNIPNLPTMTTDDKTQKRIARNIYATKKGYLIKHWTNQTLTEETFPTRNDILEKYNLPQSFPITTPPNQKLIT